MKIALMFSIVNLYSGTGPPFRGSAIPGSISLHPTMIYPRVGCIEPGMTDRNIYIYIVTEPPVSTSCGRIGSARPGYIHGLVGIVWSQNAAYGGVSEIARLNSLGGPVHPCSQACRHAATPARREVTLCKEAYIYSDYSLYNI